MAEVRAAGGLVERDGLVLLVHRPRYDDWSLPKGKLDPGEGFEEAALREVEEEAGLRCALGEELPPTRYTDRKGRPKEVRYWRMTVLHDAGHGLDDEVDELAWLAPTEAAARCTYTHDRELVAAYASAATTQPTLEIERKFLVSRDPPLDGACATTLRQGYLATGEVEVRVREADGSCTLTVKSAGGLVRREEDLPIDLERFERLWHLTQGRRVEKVRHVVEQDVATLEVDVYAGANAGLVVVEVEFTSPQAARAWTPPPWFGREVTEDPAFKNQTLAR